MKRNVLSELHRRRMTFKEQSISDKEMSRRLGFDPAEEAKARQRVLAEVGVVEKKIEDDLPDNIDLTRCKIIRRGPPKDHKLDVLRDSRDLTQTEVARKAKMTQGEVSRAERTDCKVSSLRRYAKAIGGELPLYVQIGKTKYPIAFGGRP